MGAVVEESSVKPEQLNEDVGYFQLFRFAKWSEVLLILLAVIFAAGSAGCWPLILIAYGEFTALLVDRTLTRGEVYGAPLLNLVGGGQSM